MRRTRTGDVRERFFDRFKVDEGTGCWNWTGTCHGSGYGIISGTIDGIRVVPKGLPMLAHRASWMLHFGTIKEIEGTGRHGTVIRHKCDNRKCVNPAHLEIGTQSDNVKDMDVRGGSNRTGLVPKYGINHHNSVLKEKDVKFIIESTETNGFLAQMFGVGNHTIQRVRCGKTGYTDSETAKLLKEEAKKRKGLRRPGTSNPNSKINQEIVEYIKASPLSTYKLAVELGIHQTTVARARRGKTYSAK